MKKKNVTIKDIARAAGVTHPTVSRALNNHPAIAESTREQIVELAHEMGYVPNASARGLKTNRTRALGAILQQIDDPFWSEVLDGVESILHSEGYSLFIASTHNEKPREKEVLQAMVERGVDGVLLMSPHLREEQCRFLNSYNLPMVMVNNEGVGESRYVILNDDVYAARLITKHLIELGHKRIAYLGKQYSASNRNRLAGFRAEMHAARLHVEKTYVFHTLEGNPVGGREGAEFLFSLDEIPSAVVCYNDFIAVGVYHFLQEKGLRIPQDVSVTGFDNILIASYLYPPLTTFHQYKFELGEGAARMMLEVLSDQQKKRERPPAKKVSMKGVLKIRASTSAFRSQTSN
jgi:DNA-binding LacI/PurR family transcriptional regulator